MKLRQNERTGKGTNFERRTEGTPNNHLQVGKHQGYPSTVYFQQTRKMAPCKAQAFQSTPVYNNQVML